MAKGNMLLVQNIEIGLISINEQDYICLTDMAKAKDDAGRSNLIIQNWMRNRNNVEFFGVWEQLHNPGFKGLEFEAFKKEAGLNSFVLTPKKWIETTNAIGFISKSGRYGGTYAHKDIAFNFGMWISPVFQLYVVKEYQRLKEIENSRYNLEWNVKRILSKMNYAVHTDAIKSHIIPRLTLSDKKEWIYADEADMLNIVMFGCTAKQWRKANPQKALDGENIRDMASINELVILSNIENFNSELIKQGLDKRVRAKILANTVKEQRRILDGMDMMRAIKKPSESTFLQSSPDNQLLSSPHE
ncbi:KilA-N domain protein [Bacteroidales bacterium Barb6XT]|nr:KilA-N domain protein [Bacteroidales bacterium Barb6XT]